MPDANVRGFYGRAEAKQSSSHLDTLSALLYTLLSSLSCSIPLMEYIKTFPSLLPRNPNGEDVVPDEA